MKKVLKDFTLENFGDKSILVINRRLLDSEKKELGTYIVPRTDDNTKLTVAVSEFNEIYGSDEVYLNRKEPTYIEDTILESGDYITFRDMHMNLCIGQFDTNLIIKTVPMLKFKSLYYQHLGLIYSENDKDKEFDFTCISADNFILNVDYVWKRESTKGEIEALNSALKGELVFNSEEDEVEDETDKEQVDIYKEGFEDFDIDKYKENPDKYELVFFRDFEKYPARIISEGEVESDEFDIIVAYHPQEDSDEICAYEGEKICAVGFDGSTEEFPDYSLKMREIK